MHKIIFIWFCFASSAHGGRSQRSSRHLRRGADAEGQTGRRIGESERAFPRSSSGRHLRRGPDAEGQTGTLNSIIACTRILLAFNQASAFKLAGSRAASLTGLRPTVFYSQDRPGFRFSMIGMLTPGLPADQPPAVVVQQAVQTGRQKSSFVTAAVNSVGPSVVSITTEKFVKSQDFGNLIPGLDGDQQPRIRGQGSGVIIDDDGLIMTNAHVVNNANKVTVTLTDGRSLDGSVLGIDDYLDLAAVKIKVTEGKLPSAAPLGQSTDVQVGDWAVAIGNSAGLDSTVTLGIVSALSRSSAEIGVPNEKVNFIQTDAAINPGNSGGPLLNEFGEVIGINTLIRANAAGIGFAIPIDTAEPAVRELAEGRKIPHSYIGVSMAKLTVEEAKKNNADPNSDIMLPEVPGALIMRVGPDTPAAKAGFRKFDVIQEISGRKILTPSEAQSMVDAAKVGQQLKCKVIRQSKPVSLLVTTGNLNDPQPQQVPSKQ